MSLFISSERFYEIGRPETLKEFKDNYELFYRNIIFDRDGIINDVVIRQDTVSSPRNLNEFVLEKDFKEFVNKLPSSLNLFVATNQPDVARGLFKKNHFKKMHEHILEIYPIREIFVCMHDNKDMCACRKPKPGMIEKIINKYNLSKFRNLHNW